MKNSKFIIGIDATNLNYGGGKTHLIELLKVADPIQHKFSKIIVWAARETLNSIDDKDWIIKISPLTKNNLIFRLLWQYLSLSNQAQKLKCNILFVPGGIYIGNFINVVTMSQNLLPFVQKEYERYNFTSKILKLFLLRHVQSYSFKKARGIIFLTDHAKKTIHNIVGILNSKSAIIPHGLNRRFIVNENLNLKKQKNTTKVIKILYVSHIELYKHQWNVIEGLAKLREENCNVSLNLVGSPGLGIKKLKFAIKKYDPNGEWINFQDHVEYDKMHLIYQNFNFGIFASSCENLPITLLEMIGSKMRIACSNISPMTEILGNKGVYFDPTDPISIADAIKKLIDFEIQDDLEIDDKFLKKFIEKYNWKNTAKLTFNFLNQFRKNL